VEQVPLVLYVYVILKSSFIEKIDRSDHF